MIDNKKPKIHMTLYPETAYYDDDDYRIRQLRDLEHMNEDISARNISLQRIRDLLQSIAHRRRDTKSFVEAVACDQLTSTLNELAFRIQKGEVIDVDSALDDVKTSLSEKSVEELNSEWDLD